MCFFRFFKKEKPFQLSEEEKEDLRKKRLNFYDNKIDKVQQTILRRRHEEDLREKLEGKYLNSTLIYD